MKTLLIAILMMVSTAALAHRTPVYESVNIEAEEYEGMQMCWYTSIFTGSKRGWEAQGDMLYPDTNRCVTFLFAEDF